MAGNFIPMVYAVLKDKGVDTSKMTTEQAIEKYNELGPKWGILSRHFKGKNSNDLSNRWKYLNSHKCKSKKDKINSENKRSTVTKKEDIIRKNENAHNNSLPKKADTSRFPSISLLIKDLPIFNVKQRE